MEIKPQARQEVFLRSPADIAIYGGGAGGGKTFALLLEGLRHVNNPAFGAVIFRATHPQIINEGGLWDTSEELYPHCGGIPIKGNTEWRFPSGARVRFAYMQRDTDKYKWQGAQIPYIGFDELTHFTEGMFFYMLSRNRSTSGVNPYIRATTNPDEGSWVAKFIEWWIDQETGFPIPERDGKLRWFYREDDSIRWFDCKQEARESMPHLAALADPKSVTFISAKVYDNQILLQKNPEYLASLLALPKVERERLLDGNWKVKAAGGTVFNRAWFEIVGEAPVKGIKVRYWDKAGTEDGGAYTAGVKMLKDDNGLYYVVDCIRGRWGALQRETVIRQTAELDGHDTEIGIEQEPGSGGKESAEATIRSLAGYKVYAYTKRQNKVEAAMPFSAQAEAGNVKIVRGAWNKEYLDELHNFDGKSGYKDQVDATSGAFNILAGKKMRGGISVYAIDRG